MSLNSNRDTVQARQVSQTCGTISITRFETNRVSIADCNIADDATSAVVTVANDNTEAAAVDVEWTADGKVLATKTGATIPAESQQQVSAPLDTSGLSEGDYTVSVTVGNIRGA